jgi:chromosome segregation ATPase
LTQQKEKIGQHVWNLTDKLKSVSAQQEMTNKQHLALQADMEETISTHRKELDTRARQEGRIQATLEEKERLWTMEKEVLENALNEAKKENIESEQNARKLLERCETAEGSSKEMTGQNQQLRREVARVKERSASLQQDLQEERTALVTLRQQVRQQILLFYY